MARETDGFGGSALTVLRVARGWNQRRLAEAAALSESAISLYESGERQAPVRRLAAAMGFAPEAVERAQSYLRAARAARATRQTPPAGPAATDPAAAEIDLLAHETGLWFAQLVRLGLARAVSLDPSSPSAATFQPGAASPTGASETSPAAAPRPAGLRETASPGRALVILRLLSGRSRGGLAREIGVAETKLAGWERGRPLPQGAVLDRLVEAMGFPASFFDRTLTFLESLAPASPAGPVGQRPGVAVEVVGLAAREAAAAEDFLRGALTRLTGAARHLASRAAAPGLWSRFAACSPEGQAGLVREAAEFQSSGFCERLCEESRLAARDSVARARRLAGLAVLAAERTPGDSAWRSRLRGYAGSHLGNASRAGGGDLPQADRLLAAAEEQWEAGADADPAQLLNAARVLHLKASLRRDQRRVPEALALLDQALAIDRWGETPSLLISKAKAVEELGRYEDAIGLLREADALIDPEREPVSRFLVQLNLAANLCQLERYAEAQLLLAEVQAAARRLGNRLDLLRVDWQQGRVAAGLGRVEEALATLNRVRAEFADRGNAYNAALITVELAEIYAALGRPGDVRAMARRSAPIFRAQGVHREARRALALFRRAAEQEKATAKLIRNVIAYLYRARHDPQLRFEVAA